MCTELTITPDVGAFQPSPCLCRQPRTALASFPASTFRLGCDSLSIAASGSTAPSSYMPNRHTYLGLIHITAAPHSDFLSYISFFFVEESQEFFPFQNHSELDKDLPMYTSKKEKSKADKLKEKRCCSFWNLEGHLSFD